MVRPELLHNGQQHLHRPRVRPAANLNVNILSFLLAVRPSLPFQPHSLSHVVMGAHLSPEELDELT